MSFREPCFSASSAAQCFQPRGRGRPSGRKMSPMATQNTQSPKTPEFLDLNALPDGRQGQPCP